jgi:glycosyltransferase involved in cell wall biosynthesis
VDVDHFGAARLDDTVVPEDARFDSPVAGYFGVIDERLDYDLIATLARELPNFTIVMVGPTAKVSPEELPQAPNIRWLGQRSYDDLPRYVKAFDVCLMPFALNAATQYINPTKTLEYMAAGKPIVSTAVADVVRNFVPVVSIARTHDDFVEATRRAKHSPDLTLIADGIEMARRSSWESIVRRMQNLIHEAVDEPALISTIENTEGASARSVARTSSETGSAVAQPGV